MQVREPLYQVSSQVGKYSWRFAAWATWLLGFATWNIMYFLGRMSDAQPIPPGLPGPASFVSVWVGDGVALPVINALIVLFYYKGSSLETEMTGKVSSRPIVVGGRVQTSIVVFIAALATVGTYISWFSVNKVDWSIPKPGELNVPGVYHAIFLGAEIYFLSTFAISTARFFLVYPKLVMEKGIPIALQNQLLRPLVLLLRIFGAVAVAGDVFAAALLADVRRGLIPLSSYTSTAIFAFLPSMIVTLLILLRFRGKFLVLFLRDIWAPLFLLVAIVGGIALLWEI